MVTGSLYEELWQSCHAAKSRAMKSHSKTFLMDRWQTDSVEQIPWRQREAQLILHLEIVGSPSHHENESPIDIIVIVINAFIVTSFRPDILLVERIHKETALSH